MKIKRNLGDFTKSDDAVTGIVVTTLLIGLFVTIFSIIQTVYVPQWMEQKESEHIIQLHSPLSSNLSISTPITLGSEKIPYLLSEKSYGELAIVSDECSITIKGEETISHPIGTIRYSSRNFYFVDQSYIYEAWANVRKQATSKVVDKGDWKGYDIALDKHKGWKGGVYIGGKRYKVEWSGKKPVIDQLYYIVLTYDGSAVTMYVDGAKEDTTPASGSLKSNSNDLSIGSVGGKSKFFSGVIDEVSVYGKALTLEDQRTLWECKIKEVDAL